MDKLIKYYTDLGYSITIEAPYSEFKRSIIKFVSPEGLYFESYISDILFNKIDNEKVIDYVIWISKISENYAKNIQQNI